MSDGLNTAGYTFQGPEEERQVDFTVRIDHNFNSKNSIFGRWSHGHQNTIGDACNLGLQPFPNAPNIVNTKRQPRNLAIPWRYTSKATITNEFVVGMNRLIFNFVTPDPNVNSTAPFVLNGDFNNQFLANPRINGIGNLRALTTIQFVDNLSYIRGPHQLKFGTNIRYQRHIDDRGSIGNFNANPLVFFDTDVNRVDSVAFNLPDKIDGTQDLPALQGAINNLLGRVGKIRQSLVSENANQFAPAGSHLRDDFRMPEYDFYVKDTWKIRPNLTVDFGLRWEVKLSPRTSDNFLLRPDQPFGSAATPSDRLAWTHGHLYTHGYLYKDAWRNFGPSIGIALPGIPSKMVSRRCVPTIGSRMTA